MKTPTRILVGGQEGDFRRFVLMELALARRALTEQGN